MTKMQELVIKRDELEAKMAPLYNDSHMANDYEEWMAIQAKIEAIKKEWLPLLQEISALAEAGEGYKFYTIKVKDGEDLSFKGTGLDAAQKWLEENHTNLVPGANIIEVKEDGSKLLFPDFSMYSVDWTPKAA